MKKLVVLLFIGFATRAMSQDRAEIFKNSYIAESKKDYSKAISYIEEDENLASCYECNFRLGWLHYLNGDNPKSIKHYKAALQIEKTSVEPLYGLTYPYSVLKQWDNIANCYREILKKSPSQINALYYLGIYYYHKKDYVNAKANCQKILDLYPLNYYSNLFMGDIYTAEGDANKAKEYYNIAAIYNMPKKELSKVTDKSCYACNLRLGWLAFEGKEYSVSLKEYGIAESILPNSLEPYYGQTYSYAAKEDVEQLISLYTKIISLDKENTYALYSLAYYQLKQKEIEEAEKNCQKVLDLFPFDYYSNVLMGNIKLAMGKEEETRLYLERALVYNPNENITKTRLQKLSRR